MRRPLALLALLVAGPAYATVPPSQWYQGYVPTLSDWQAAFAAQLSTINSLDTSLSAASTQSLVRVANGGNFISYCPALSCVVAPSSDHQRTSALLSSVTSADGQAEEQTLGVETVVRTGYAKPWTVSTAFSVGDNTITNGNVYRAVTAGVSAATGTGPGGTGSSITDGTLVWAWINQAAIDAKVGIYDEVSVQPGAGESWGQATNVQMQPGAVPSFDIGQEIDFTNDSGTGCTIGLSNCNLLELEIGGSNQSTTGIHLSSKNAGPTYAAHWGIRLNTQYLASDDDIEDDAAAAIGLGFNASGFGSGGHSTATIEDNSTGSVGLLLLGLKTASDINDQTSSPAAIDNVGPHPLGTIYDNSTSSYVLNTMNSHAVAVWNDTSTSPAAEDLSGSYALAAIFDGTSSSNNSTFLSVAANHKICFAGQSVCLYYNPTTKILYGSNSSNAITWHVDDSGNAVFKGTVTQNGTP